MQHLARGPRAEPLLVGRDHLGLQVRLLAAHGARHVLQGPQGPLPHSRRRPTGLTCMQKRHKSRHDS